MKLPKYRTPAYFDLEDGEWYICIRDEAYKLSDLIEMMEQVIQLMNPPEMERLLPRSMDIVKFAEEIMGLELYPFQKKVLRRYQEVGKVLVTKRQPGWRTLTRVLKEYEVWSVAKTPS